jgi:Tol biopolymer transport system component
MRSRAALLIAAALLAAGCAHAGEAISIPPLPDTGGRVNPGLGPGTRPLSSGPGYKGSPSWSPRGDRIAYIVDGYVAARSVKAADVRRCTTTDFLAEDVEWTSERGLMILGSPSGAREVPRSVYRAGSAERSLGVEEIAEDALTMGPASGEESMLIALQTTPSASGLALVGDDGAVERVYTGTIRGRITGVSVSPDGRKAVLATRTRGERPYFELHVLDLREGVHRRIARLDEDLEVFGAPQWTRRGIYYVAGRNEMSADGSAAPHYELYRIPPRPAEPEPAPGVGEGFVVSSIRVSPEGGRLAVIGRLDTTAPTNLYVLDLHAEDLEALTDNEDMVIRTGPDDLAWSPGGESIAIVARGALSKEPSVHAAPASALLDDFYNIYEVPVGASR